MSLCAISFKNFNDLSTEELSKMVREEEKSNENVIAKAALYIGLGAVIGAAVYMIGTSLMASGVLAPIGAAMMGMMGPGAAIGADIVELMGYADCWKACSSQGNPVAGMKWFYGDQLGIDFTSGAPVPDFNGASHMTAYNSSPLQNYSFTWTIIIKLNERNIW